LLYITNLRSNNMKSITNTLLTFIGLMLFSLVSTAQVNPSQTYVPAHYRTNGTYISGYYKTTPNSTNRDNFTTKPNVNPYTLKPGYIEPDNKSALTSTTLYKSSLESKPASSTSLTTIYSVPSYTTPTTSSYSRPIIQTGTRGGQYYINSNGNKTYVKN